MSSSFLRNRFCFFFFLVFKIHNQEEEKKILTFSLLFCVSRLIEAVERNGFGANIFNDGVGVC
jgi:hypothetical protein